MRGLADKHSNPLSDIKSQLVQWLEVGTAGLAPDGIRVNAVVPGSMDTPMLWVDQLPEAAATVADFSSLGRVGQPIEIARPILFLLSDWASYITGHSLDIDGGWLFR